MNSFKQWIRRRKGLTLVEVMVATLVISLGFMGILGTATHIMRLVRVAREETRAITAAQHALETVKTYSWVRLNLMQGESTFNITGNQAFSALDDPSCTITVVDAPGEAGRMRLISARVRWRRASGDYGERELASFLARKKRLR